MPKITKKPSLNKEIKVSYNILDKYLSKMHKIFEKHNITWEKTECISDAGEPIEWGGVITGSYADVFKFIQSAFGKMTDKQFKSDYVQE